MKASLSIKIETRGPDEMVSMMQRAHETGRITSDRLADIVEHLDDWADFDTRTEAGTLVATWAPKPALLAELGEARP